MSHMKCSNNQGCGVGSFGMESELESFFLMCGIGVSFFPYVESDFGVDLQ